MLSVYIYCTKEEDARRITDLLRDVLVHMGGEQMTAEVSWARGSRKDKDTGPLNLMVCEVSRREDFDALLTIRRQNLSAELLIIDGKLMEAEEYIRPDLRPSGLLAMPLDYERVRKLLWQVIQRIYQDRERESEDSCFMVRKGQEYYHVPYSFIHYLEAKDKYIYLHHDRGTVRFRDSLRRLDRVLPDYFLRTHRGLIVNFRYTRRLDLAAGTITMADSTVIPMSRSFRQRLAKVLPGSRGSEEKTGDHPEEKNRERDKTDSEGWREA